MNIPALLTMIGALTAVTNIVVEVLKKATYDKIPTNLLAIVVAEILTIAAGFAYLQINGFPILWYYVVAIIVGGFMVAFCAMFGFDKLKEILNWKKKENQ